MSRYQDLAEQLDQVIAELDDLSFDLLQRAVADGATERPAADRTITQARRAVEKAAARGIDCKGPYPSDTVFIKGFGDEFDGVLSMYHDQGQIAMKLMGFDRGVTLHGGLPVPVATCASGTAFDIVGKGIANVEGLQAAFDLAARIAARGAAARAA